MIVTFVAIPRKSSDYVSVLIWTVNKSIIIYIHGWVWLFHYILTSKQFHCWVCLSMSVSCGLWSMVAILNEISVNILNWNTSMQVGKTYTSYIISLSHSSASTSHSSHMTSSKWVDTLVFHTTMHRNDINVLYNPVHVTLWCFEVVPVVYAST